MIDISVTLSELTYPLNELVCNRRVFDHVVQFDHPEAVGRGRWQFPKISRSDECFCWFLVSAQLQHFGVPRIPNRDGIHREYILCGSEGYKIGVR